MNTTEKDEKIEVNAISPFVNDKWYNIFKDRRPTLPRGELMFSEGYL